jgi:thiamine pyrophosphokinase
MRAVVVAHGDVDEADARHARAADLVIAADGGSEHLARWGIRPAVVIGDLDSVTVDPTSAGARVERWPRDKDQSDTELAVRRAFAEGADDVVVLGALGGPRPDHAIANVLLLALDGGSHGRVRIVRGPVSMRHIGGGEALTLDGSPGGLVTLLAIGGDAQGVRTEGLRYALRGEELHLGSSRGLSNEVMRAGATVSVGSGSLLVIEGAALPAGTEPQAKA